MRTFVRIIPVLLLCLVMLCLLLPAVRADDNVTTGDGDTHAAAKGYGWYREREYLWKVSLYAGKADTSTRTDELSSGFRLIGTVYVRKPGWDIPSRTQFGSGTKVSYLAGESLSPATDVTVYSVDNCPPVPIVCEKGNLDDVKAFFGSTGTLSFLLNAAAAERHTDAETLLENMPFTIGGKTKTGWPAEMLLPDGENNRIPWAVVYEPVIVLRLKDGKNRLAFTATEFALAQRNGWYDFHKSGGRGQWVDNLTHRHLPTSVLLEESWFGYPVFPPTDGMVMWDEEDIILGGGWGMRFLNAAVSETAAVDYFTAVKSVDRFTVGKRGSVTVSFCNALEREGTARCRVLLDGRVLLDRVVSFAPRATKNTVVSVLLPDTEPHILHAEVYGEGNTEDLTPEDNETELTLRAGEDETKKPEFSCRAMSDDVTAGRENAAYVLWTNGGTTGQPVLCELYYGSVQETNCVFRAYRTIPVRSSLGEYIWYTVPDADPKPLISRIRYADRMDELDPDNNEQTEWIFPLSDDPADKPDFRVASLTATPAEAPFGTAITLHVRLENRSPYAFTSVPAALLLNGTGTAVWYDDYPAYGAVERTLTVYPEESGVCLLTVRVNWEDRMSESDPTDNSRSAKADRPPEKDFAVHALQCEEEWPAGDPVTVSFTALNLSEEGFFPDVPVEVLEGDSVVWSQCLDFAPRSGYDLTVTYPCPDSRTGNFRVTARVRWEDRADEADPDNNASTATAARTRAREDFALEAVLPNAPYTEGTDVITTFRLHNRTGTDLTDRRFAEVVMTVYSGRDGEMLFRTTQSAVCPANGSNLVYFRWHVPSGISGAEIVCVGELTPPDGIADAAEANDRDELSVLVKAPVSTDTPDTRFEKKAPNGWTAAGKEGTTIPCAVWEEWICTDGVFTRVRREVRPESGNILLTPDANAFAAVQTGENLWDLPSGYGFSVLWSPEPGEADYVTGFQTGSMLWPEYGYEETAGKMTSLLWDGNSGKFVLPGAERLHFLPLWMPDGPYVPVLLASDCWTPAGKMTGRTPAEGLNVSHSAYDGWYLGA